MGSKRGSAPVPTVESAASAWDRLPSEAIAETQRRFSAISVRCWTSSASFPLPPGLGVAGTVGGWRKTESITRDGQCECVGEEQMGSKLLFN